MAQTFDLHSTFDSQMTSHNASTSASTSYSTSSATSTSAINEDISPLSSLLGQRTEAIAFTHRFFLNSPHLFGSNAETLMYTQHAGHKFKPATYYHIFETFIRSSNSTLISDRRNGRLSNAYTYDSDFIITWARIIKHNRVVLQFEPVMANLIAVLNTYLSNPTVTYGGITYPLATFKPLCYTHSGECIISLLPYICYLLTFFIHCNPYEFDEAQSESSAFGFYRSIESWFMKHYVELGNDFGCDILNDPVATSVSKIGDKYWIDMLNSMLNIDVIIKIRNEEIARTPQLLEQCVQGQNGFDIPMLTRRWNDVMGNLIKLIIKANPIKRVFDIIPQFNPTVLDVNELMSLTEYCMAGGNGLFCIRPEVPYDSDVNTAPAYSYYFNADPASVKALPTSIAGPQQIASGVTKLSIAAGKPFAAADVLLSMATAYVRDAFLRKRTDILDPNPIRIGDDVLRDDRMLGKPLAEVLRDVFINGVWMLDNGSMTDALTLLMQSAAFMDELNDIQSLTAITQIVYDNRAASIVLPTLLLSYLNGWLLETCMNGWKLEGLSMMTYAAIMDVDMMRPRVAKLMNMLAALTHLGNGEYVRFVNGCETEFVKMMSSGVVVAQPYIKGLNDAADVYAIGGCELYNYSHFSNPLIRGYGFLSTVFGNCEMLETFFAWIRSIDNSALFDVINESLGNVNLVETSLKQQWNKMVSMKRMPPVLRNWVFTPTGYRLNMSPYHLTMMTSDGMSMTQLVCKYAFPFSNPRTGTKRKLVMRKLDVSDGVVIANRPLEGMLMLDGTGYPFELTGAGSVEDVPVYDFNGTMEEVGVSYVNPKGMRCVKLKMYNGRGGLNQVMWVWTKAGAVTRFQRYDLGRREASPEGVSGGMTDRVMGIVGTK